MNKSRLPLLFLLLIPMAKSDEYSYLPPLVNPKIVKTINKGLKWLVRNQLKDGSWRSSGVYGYAPVAMTSMAGLALLSTGSTPTRGPYALNIRKAVEFILRNIHSSGLISAVNEESRAMYGHGFATLFLAQVLGMEEDKKKQEKLKKVLKNAVSLISSAQSSYGGWYYIPDAYNDEGSVTVTQIQALRACQEVGIPVKKEVIKGAINYIVKSSNPDGGIRYRAGMEGPSRPAITAAAVATLYNAGKYDHPIALKALEFAKNFVRPEKTTTSFYYYSHNYLAQALYQRGGKEWEEYYKKISKKLMDLQSSNGSWRKLSSAGVVYSTSVALIILQLPWGYVPAFQR